MLKAVFLVLVACLGGCSAGNLSIDHGNAIRVSSCDMTDDAVVTYTRRGVTHTLAPKVAHFENTIISPIGSDVCTETGYLCQKGE